MQKSDANVAQLVEQLIRNQQVGGSSPPISSRTPLAEFFCRRSSVAESQLPKLIMRVRFPSPAPYRRGRHIVRGHFLRFSLCAAFRRTQTLSIIARQEKKCNRYEKDFRTFLIRTCHMKAPRKSDISSVYHAPALACSEKQKNRTGMSGRHKTIHCGTRNHVECRLIFYQSK